MNRLGKSLITDSELLSLDRIVAEIDGVDAASVAELAAALLASERLSAAVYRPERGAVPAPRSSASRRPRARGVNVLLNGRGGKVGSVLAPALEAAGHRLVDSLAEAEAMVDFTRPDAALANVRAAVEAGVPSVVGTTGWDIGRRRDATVTPVLLRAELRDRGGADDALRGGGGAALRSAQRSSSCTMPTKLDAPSGTAKATAERDGGNVPIHSVRLPGLVAHQEVMLGGRGPAADDPPRRDLARGVHPGRAAGAREAAVAAAGPDRRA